MVDAGKGEVVIVRNCVLASRIRSAYVNIWKKKGIRLLSQFCGNIICVSATYHSENIVEIITLGLLLSILQVHGIRKRTVDISAPLRCVFSISQ